MIVILGPLLLTACKSWGESACVVGPLFSLSSDAVTVTTARTIRLTAFICSDAPAPAVDFYDGNTQLRGLTNSSLSAEPLEVFLPLSLVKAQNGVREYTAKMTLRGTEYTTNPVTVTVNIP
jgi:hypothetical protein